MFPEILGPSVLELPRDRNRPPSGKDVVAPPPPDHPHHKGLQFGLCASDVNFWEGDKAHEPSNRRLTIDQAYNSVLLSVGPTAKAPLPSLARPSVA